MNTFSKIIYLFSIAIFIYASSLCGVTFSYLYDVPSLFFIIGGLIFTFVNYNFSDVKNTFKIALSSNLTNIEKNELILSKEIINKMWSYVLFSSITLVLAGIIFSLAESDTSKIGVFLALIFIGVFYALFLKLFLFMPLETSLKRKMILKLGISKF